MKFFLSVVRGDEETKLERSENKRECSKFCDVAAEPCSSGVMLTFSPIKSTQMMK